MAIVRVNFARFSDGTVEAYYTYDDGTLNIHACGVENNSGRASYAQAQDPGTLEIFSVTVDPFTQFEEDLTPIRPRLRMVQGGDGSVGPPYLLEARWPA